MITGAVGFALVIESLGGFQASALEVAVGALALLAALVVVFLRPFVGLLAILAVLPFEAAYMVGEATIPRLLAIAVVGSWVLNKLLRGERWASIAAGGLLWAGTLFIALAFASILWAKYVVGVPLQIVRLATILILGLVVLDLSRSWGRVLWITKVLVAGGLVAAVLTLVQYFEPGVSRAGRAVAGGIDATAMMLVSLVPFGFCLFRSAQARWWRIVGLAYLVLAPVSITLTFSRMSFIVFALLVVAEYWSMLKVGRNRLALVALAAIACFAFLKFVPREPLEERVHTIGPYLEQTLRAGNTYGGTTSERGYHVRIALAIFADHPIIGVGYWNYGPYFLDYQPNVPGNEFRYRSPRSPHGTVWGVVAELGIVGLTLWLLLIGVGVGNLKRAWRRTSDDKADIRFLLVRAVTYSFAAQLANALYEEIHVFKLFWVLLGIAVALRRLCLIELSVPYRFGAAIDGESLPRGRQEVLKVGVAVPAGGSRSVRALL